MNTAIIVKNINNQLYSLKVKTKFKTITFPFSCKFNATPLNVSKNIELIVLPITSEKVSIFDKYHGIKLVQGKSAKELINKLSFLLDK